MATTKGRSTEGVGDKDGVIIFDHGCRRKGSNLMLSTFSYICKELAEPSMRDAFASCVQHETSRVVVSPFFLFPGRHCHQDIPSLTVEAAEEHPDVQYIITAPLGLQELLVIRNRFTKNYTVAAWGLNLRGFDILQDVVYDTIKYCLDHVARDAEQCSISVETGKYRLYG